MSNSNLFHIQTDSKQGPDEQEDVQIAMETCPVDVIHWVTLPQLSLLEAALGRMARVGAFRGACC